MIGINKPFSLCLKNNYIDYIYIIFLFCLSVCLYVRMLSPHNFKNYWTDFQNLNGICSCMVPNRAQHFGFENLLPVLSKKIKRLFYQFSLYFANYKMFLKS